MKSLSTVAQAIEPSATLAIDALYKQMLAEGKDVVGFGAGEPDFNTPDNIKMAALQAITANMTRYTPAVGTVELRKAIAQRLKQDCGVEYDFKQICVSNGAKSCVYVALRALVNPGDEVIIPQPSFVCYEPLTVMAGGVPVIINTKNEDNFRLRADDLRAAITGKTKLLVLPSRITQQALSWRSTTSRRSPRCVSRRIYSFSPTRFTQSSPTADVITFRSRQSTECMSAR